MNYRISVDMIENGYVDVEATSDDEAIRLAEDEINAGGFVGHNSHASIGKIIERK